MSSAEQLLRSSRSSSVVALVVLLASTAWAQGPGEAGLAPRLEAILRSQALREARVATLVVDVANGAVLFAHEPDRAMSPASNQKILTALAAAAELGPTHRFVTEVLTGARPDGEGAVPWLAIRGGGDPSLTSEQWWRLAADLRRLGVRRVEGPVWLDASAFDAERWPRAWGPPSARAYHAPVAALSANYGAFAVVVGPGTAGSRARVSVDPPVPYLSVLNQASSGPRGSASDLAIERRAGQGVEQILVTGHLGEGAEPEVFWRSVLDPVAYAGAVLAMQLDANGIAVAGPVAAGPVPPGAIRLHAFEGKELSEVLRLLAKYSSNVIAESLLKSMGSHAFGGPGSFATGMEALRLRLHALGVPLEGARLVDGSGLARSNRVTPRLLVAALRVLYGSFEFGPELVSALPIAGRDGTLSERAEAATGRVRAKTGLLDGVTGLSGFARLADGRVAAFSFLVNGFRQGAPAARQAADRFVEALVR